MCMAIRPQPILNKLSRLIYANIILLYVIFWLVNTLEAAGLEIL